MRAGEIINILLGTSITGHALVLNMMGLDFMVPGINHNSCSNLRPSPDALSMTSTPLDQRLLDKYTSRVVHIVFYTHPMLFSSRSNTTIQCD